MANVTIKGIVLKNNGIGIKMSGGNIDLSHGVFEGNGRDIVVDGGGDLTVRNTAFHGLRPEPTEEPQPGRRERYAAKTSCKVGWSPTYKLPNS